MANFCRKCGARLPEGALFCPACGNKIAESGPASASPYSKNQANDPVRPLQAQVNRKPAKSRVLNTLSISLGIILAFEAVVACFWYPGFFKGRVKPHGEEIETTAEAETGGHVTDNDTASNIQPILDYLGVSEEYLSAISKSEIAPTPQNSPGNPAFIDISFTEEERNNAKTLSAPVSLENPEADFPQFGIHADLKWWNLQNGEDTLIIKRLPVKTCSVTGSTLYTYDISLASGQKEFPTEVEITFPVQGEALAFDGSVHRNDETGKWEEDYYTLSEDGLFYTSRMTHFSDDAQRSSEAVIRQIEQDGKNALEYYKSDGKSIFKVMPKEDNSKYQGVNTYLYGVGLVKIPDFEKYLKSDEAYAVNVLRKLFEESGDIPAEAGEAVSLAAMGTKGDTISTLQTVITGTVLNDSNTTQAVNDFNVHGGVALTVYGLVVLGVRLADQYERGVSWTNRWNSNSWNVLNSFVSMIGSAAAVAGAAPVATGAAIVCAAIYAYTRIGEYKEAKFKAERPLGYPDTLEEGAFYYYAADYDDGTENAIQHVLQKVIKEIPAPDGRNHALGYDTEINIRGTGWPQALKFIFDHYQSDPEALANAVAMMYSEYEKYIDRFFDGMNGQSGDSSALRDECWRAFCSKALSPENADRLRLENGRDYELNMRLFAAENEISESQAWRWEGIASWADRQQKSGKKWDEVWNISSSDPINYNGYNNHYDFGKVNTFGDLIEFDSIDRTQMDLLKKHAKETLYGNTNTVIHAFYKRYYDDAIREVRDILLEKVLPWLNTQVSFYIDDKTLGPDQSRSDTRFNTFWLKDSYTAFIPGNGADYGTDIITLKKNEGKPFLLVTNIYHYLRCGCPTNVEIFIKGGNRTSESLNGKIDWTGVDISEDPAAVFNGMDPEYIEFFSAEAAASMIQDIKVPVIYGDSLAKLEGSWRPPDKSSEYVNTVNDNISLSVGPYGQNCSFSISSAIKDPRKFSASDSDFAYVPGQNGDRFSAIKKDGSDSVTYTIKQITDDVLYINELSFYLERTTETLIDKAAGIYDISGHKIRYREDGEVNNPFDTEEDLGDYTVTVTLKKANEETLGLYRNGSFVGDLPFTETAGQTSAFGKCAGKTGGISYSFTFTETEDTISMKEFIEEGMTEWEGSGDKRK